MKMSARKSVCLAVQLTACALLLALSLEAQETQPGIHLPTNWRVGEKYRINVVKEKIGADGTNDFTGNATVQFELRQRSDDGYLFVWTVSQTDNGHVNGHVKGAADALESLADMLGVEDLRIELRTNRAGQPIQIVNLDDIVAHSRSRIDQLAVSPNKKIAREAKKYLEEEFRPEKLAEVGLGNADIFYLACGASFLREGETVNRDDNSGSIPAKITFGLSEVRRDAGEAVIAYTRVTDSTKLNAALADKFAQNRREAARMGFCRNGCPNPESMPKYEIEERATYVMDLKTGWPNSVIYEWEAKVGGKRHELNRTTLTRIETQQQ